MVWGRVPALRMRTMSSELLSFEAKIETSMVVTVRMLSVVLLHMIPALLFLVDFENVKAGRPKVINFNTDKNEH